jgi:hypothetical protein
MGNKLNENKLDDVFPGSCISKAFIWPSISLTKLPLNSNDLEYL